MYGTDGLWVPKPVDRVVVYARIRVRARVCIRGERYESFGQF